MNEVYKKQAGEKAAQEIESGMLIGLGSGSTVYFTICKLSEALKTGELTNIYAIPSSISTQKLAENLEIPLLTFNEKQRIDLTIDGADEVDEHLNLIKGGGGAHLKEKILVQASDKFIVVVDESKISKKLGEKWRVPIEVIKFSYPVIKSFIESINGKPELRKLQDGSPILTDEGNYIIDANFGIIKNPAELAEKLDSRAGIVEHGLFLGYVHKLIIAGKNGLSILKH